MGLNINSVSAQHYGGFLVVVRKFSRLLYYSLFLPVTIPLVLLIRAIRPIVLIRFVQLFSFRIGHFAANTEIYLCRRDAGMVSSKIIDLFCHSPGVCNEQLKIMWNRSSLHIFSFVKLLLVANRILPGGEKHVLDLKINTHEFNFDFDGLIPRSQPHIAFTEDEERLGREALQKMGITDGCTFVCFYARDRKYLNNKPGHLRNSNIKNCLEAANELAKRDYFTLRMGSMVEEPLHSDDPKIIDYATKYRSDFLDIYLCAKCRFFIGGSGGLVAVPVIFRKPRVIVNWIPYEGGPAYPPKDLFILKKMWMKKERRFLTFREIFDKELGKCMSGKVFEQLGIDLIENTREEIKAVTIEMDERLKGSWRTTEEDEKLQKQFWDIYPNDRWPREALRSRVGAEFLRQNKGLLC